MLRHLGLDPFVLFGDFSHHSHVNDESKAITTGLEPGVFNIVGSEPVSWRFPHHVLSMGDWCL